MNHRHPFAVRTALIASFTAAVLLLSGCSPQDSTNNTEAITADEELTIAVASRELTPERIRRYIHVNGEIQPVSSVDVFAETGGELTRLTVAKGDRVTRNDVIGEVDPSRAGQRFAPSPVRAPISGTVVSVSPRIGSQISPQTPVARIATTDELEIAANIPDRHLGRLQTGMPAAVYLDAFPGQEFSARVSRLSPVVDQQTRTLETMLRFDRSDRRIRPGMFATVQIILEENRQALTVPQNAVIRRDGNTYVYIVDEDTRARLQPVRIGIEMDGMAELREGAAVGDRVIVRGQNLIENGTLVRIIEEL